MTRKINQILLVSRTTEGVNPTEGVYQILSIDSSSSSSGDEDKEDLKLPFPEMTTDAVLWAARRVLCNYRNTNSKGKPMRITFNQIPPQIENQVSFWSDQGDLIFGEDNQMFTYRQGSYLIIKSGNFTLSKLVRDHDELVDVYLFAFAELMEESIPRLAQE